MPKSTVASQGFSIDSHMLSNIGGNLFAIPLPLNVSFPHIWIKSLQDLLREGNQVLFGASAAYFRFDNVLSIALLIIPDQR